MSATLPKPPAFATLKRGVRLAFLPVLLLILWELGARGGVIDRRFFPPPTAIAAQAWEIITTPKRLAPLLTNLRVTGIRTLEGYLIGVIAGLAAGWAMGLSRTVRDTFSWLINGTYPMPKIAIYPLLIVLLGIGEKSKIAMIALGTFYMVSLNTINGIAFLNPLYDDIGRAFHIPWAVRQLRITLPGAMPSILTGLKLGFGQALILVVSVEFVGASEGLGYYIWQSWQVLDIPGMFMGLAIVAVVGSLTVVLGDYAERKLTPWAR